MASKRSFTSRNTVAVAGTLALGPFVLMPMSIVIGGSAPELAGACFLSAIALHAVGNVLFLVDAARDPKSSVILWMLLLFSCTSVLTNPLYFLTNILGPFLDRGRQAAPV